MHLILSSSPCIPAPESTGLAFIYQRENGFPQRLYAALPRRPRLLLVSADPEAHTHNDRMLQEFGQALAFDGYPPGHSAILDSRNAVQAHALAEKADLILLCGGHVPTQNRFLASIRLRDTFHRFGGTVLGISAGSMNAAATVYAQPEETGESDPSFPRFLPGLGLTQYQIVPHLQKVRYDVLDGKRLFEEITFPDSMGQRFLAIPDGSYVYEDETCHLLCGEGYLIHDGIMIPICQHGQTLPLPI
ncbi:MAG: dipeptidase E [Clostridia bacterium]|nr:dipeptidase E [Clostridia bacterium]